MVIVLVAGLVGFQFKLPNMIRPHEDAIAAQAKMVCQKDRSNVIVPADWTRFRLLSGCPILADRKKSSLPTRRRHFLVDALENRQGNLSVHSRELRVSQESDGRIPSNAPLC